MSMSASTRIETIDVPDHVGRDEKRSRIGGWPPRDLIRRSGKAWSTDKDRVDKPSPVYLSGISPPGPKAVLRSLKAIADPLRQSGSLRGGPPSIRTPICQPHLDSRRLSLIR